jgi:hypothetical protein
MSHLKKKSDKLGKWLVVLKLGEKMGHREHKCPIWLMDFEYKDGAQASQLKLSSLRHETEAEE